MSARKSRPKHKVINMWLSLEGVRDIEVLKRAWRVSSNRDVIERCVQEMARRERGLDGLDR